MNGLVSNAGFVVESNYENGLGRCDIVIKDRRNRRAIVIEAKAAGAESMMQAECLDSLRKIEKQQYAEKVENSGFQRVIRLGMAFWKMGYLVEKG